MRHHDPLVSIFNLLKIDHSRPARLNAAGRWSFLFAGSPHVRFGAAVKGSCWLVADGELPLWLQEGDGYLLTRGQSYRVCTDPALAPQDGVPLFRRERNGTVNHGVPSFSVQ